MSNILDPDRFIGPDLGPNCLPRLSADDTGRQRVNPANGTLLSIFNYSIDMYVTNQAKNNII